ncbi:hypothetical protein BDV10DRAFT_12626 [Aspergillus recurvatus]
MPDALLQILGRYWVILCGAISRLLEFTRCTSSVLDIERQGSHAEDQFADWERNLTRRSSDSITSFIGEAPPFSTRHEDRSAKTPIHYVNQFNAPAQSFPLQHTLSNRKTNASPQPKSDRYRPAEPTRIGASPPQWVQRPAAVKVSSLHRNTTLPHVPGHDLLQVNHILDAHVGEHAVGYDEVRSRSHDKCLVAEIYSQGRTTTQNLSYEEALSIPGGYKALRVYFAPLVSYNPTPPLPREAPDIPLPSFAA